MNDGYEFVFAVGDEEKKGLFKLQAEEPTNGDAITYIYRVEDPRCRS